MYSTLIFLWLFFGSDFFFSWFLFLVLCHSLIPNVERQLYDATVESQTEQQTESETRRNRNENQKLKQDNYWMRFNHFIILPCKASERHWWGEVGGVGNRWLWWQRCQCGRATRGCEMLWKRFVQRRKRKRRRKHARHKINSIHSLSMAEHVVAFCLTAHIWLKRMHAANTTNIHNENSRKEDFWNSNNSRSSTSINKGSNIAMGKW